MVYVRVVGKAASLLVLVRHGESARNIARQGRVFYASAAERDALKGMPDEVTPLTEEGLRQAERTGRYLATRFGAFDALYHSGYVRTVDTSEAILGAYAGSGPPRVVRRDLFLRERDPGHAFEMTEAEVREFFPWLDDYWNRTGPFFARPPGGESVAQVCERVQLFLDRLARDHAGERVLVVTHARVIQSFRFLLEDWDIHTVERGLRGSPANASVTAYAHTEGYEGYTLVETIQRPGTDDPER